MTEIWDTRTGRFDTIPAGERHEVIDTLTGHPVAAFDSRTFAEFEAASLNNAAIAGPRTLAVALGAIDENEAL